MYCCECGASNQDGSEKCSRCGSLFTLPSPALKVAVTAHPVPARNSLEGVGGWLLFFCFGLTFVQPLLNFRGAFESGGGAIEYAVAIALTSLSLTTGISLMQRSNSAFRWLVWYFGVQAVLVPLLFLASLDEIRQGQPRAIGQIVHSTLFLVCWFAYFKRSKRVRVTFGRNL